MRENRFGKRRKNQKQDKIDRNNEINIDSSGMNHLTYQTQRRNQEMVNETPTDSMMVSVINRRTLGPENQVLFNNENFEQPTIEESSYTKNELQKLDFKSKNRRRNKNSRKKNEVNESSSMNADLLKHQISQDKVK